MDPFRELCCIWGQWYVCVYTFDSVVWHVSQICGQPEVDVSQYSYLWKVGECRCVCTCRCCMWNVNLDECIHGISRLSFLNTTRWVHFIYCLIDGHIQRFMLLMRTVVCTTTFIALSVLSVHKLLELKLKQLSYQLYVCITLVETCPMIATVVVT